MELNLKDEDKLIELLKTINYNFNIMIRKTTSGIAIEDLDAEAMYKIDTYDELEEELSEAREEIDVLEERICELEYN